MERFKRQYDILRQGDLQDEVHVIGAGGIGRWTTLLLAKIGCENITVYDFDTVEDHNVASQFFKESQIGMKKVDALKENVLEQTGIEINTSEDIEDELTIPSESMVIIAIDTMEGRIKLGEAFKKKSIYIIDGRMGGLSFEIYSGLSDMYSKSLIAPENVSHDACTAKSISFNCAVIAGFIVNFFKKAIKNESDSYVSKTTYFDLVTMSMLVEKYSDSVTQTGTDIEELEEEDYDDYVGNVLYDDDDDE